MAKMKQCRDCKAEIPKNAKKCMHCGTEQGTRLGVVLGVLIVAIIIWNAVSGNGAGDVTHPVNTKQKQADINNGISNWKTQVEAEKKTFMKNRDTIIRQAKQDMRNGNYAAIIKMSTKYAHQKDPQIMALRNQARENKLLALAKTLPASKAAENLDVYKKLVSIRPDDARYKKKVAQYQAKVNLKKAEIAARIAAFGNPPAQSAWDGSYNAVERYLKRIANDPGSIDIDKCTETYHSKTGWLVGCTYRGKNAFGGTVLNANWFTIVHDRVINMQPGNAYKW